MNIFIYVKWKAREREREKKRSNSRRDLIISAMIAEIEHKKHFKGGCIKSKRTMMCVLEKTGTSAGNEKSIETNSNAGKQKINTLICSMYEWICVCVSAEYNRNGASLGNISQFTSEFHEQSRRVCKSCVIKFLLTSCMYKTIISFTFFYYLNFFAYLLMTKEMKPKENLKRAKYAKLVGGQNATPSIFTSKLSFACAFKYSLW